MDIQKMREARNKAVVVFAKFCQNKDRYDRAFFCFFEGEDVKYYEPRVEEYTGIAYDNIISFNCGGKSGVLKVRNMIKEKNVYHNVKKAFFIDRDYFETDIKDEELYETPCYAVENFYTSRTAFEKVLKRAFGINVYEEDFIRCVKDFEQAQEQFHINVTELNAWLKCQRRIELCNGRRELELTNFKVSKYFEQISIDKVKIKNALDVHNLYTIFPEANEISKEEMIEAIENMKMCNQQQDFRGKFELEFLKKIVDDLRTKNKEGKYFQEHRECVRLDPNVDSLLQLSQCADTPESLKKFLMQYKVAS